MNKVIIFGASKKGKIAFELLSKDYDIIGFADNNADKWGKTFCGKEIIAPRALQDMNGVTIVIASLYYAEIHRQLMQMGIYGSKVFDYIGNVRSVSQEGTYRIYDLPKEELFDTCVVDWDKIHAIEKNYSENYTVACNIEPISVKKTERKKVLFCAYFFPPAGGAGVQRSLKFVKYLRKYGYEPIVVTISESNSMWGEDETLLGEFGDITVIRINDSVCIPEMYSLEQQQEIFNLYCGIVKSQAWVDKFRDKVKESSNHHRVIPDSNLYWVNEVLKRLEYMVDMSEIAVVYTTGSPFSTYFLGYYIKRRYGIKWVQDYRDPWVSDDCFIEHYGLALKPTLELQRILEKKLTAFSDAIIVTCEANKENYVEKYDVNRNKIFRITNGYDEADFAAIPFNDTVNEKFTLCYSGVLYLERNPLGLLKIINSLIAKGDIDASKIQWIFNGNVADEWKQAIKKEDRYGIVKLNGYLSHADSIRLTMSSDLLIIFGQSDNDAKVVVPGKTYEYMRMGRPILGLSAKGSVLDELLIESNSGENFEYEDDENIANFILKQYNCWKSGEEVPRADMKVIQKYSREYTTKMLSELFDKVLTE